MGIAKNQGKLIRGQVSYKDGATSSSKYNVT